MDNVTPIWSAAPDCHYTLFVTHKAGGEIEVTVEGLGHDDRSRSSAAAAFRAAAAMCEAGVAEERP